MADDLATQAQAVIDMMNAMDAESGVTAQPVAQPQPQVGGLFNFLANLPIIGGFLKPTPKKASAKQTTDLSGATGALMRRKMLNEALMGKPQMSDEELIEMMSGGKR